MVFVLEGLQWGDEGKGKITDYLAELTKAITDKIKVIITTIINHLSSESSFLFFFLFAIFKIAPFVLKKYLDGKNLCKFYGLGLEEFLYFLLNITV